MTARLAATERKSSPTKPTFFEPVPMKPRKGLFAGLLVLLFVWMGVMVTMYVKTVHPHDHAPAQPATAPVVAAAV